MTLATNAYKLAGIRKIIREFILYYRLNLILIMDCLDMDFKEIYIISFGKEYQLLI